MKPERVLTDEEILRVRSEHVPSEWFSDRTHSFEDSIILYRARRIEALVVERIAVYKEVMPPESDGSSRSSAHTAVSATAAHGVSMGGDAQTVDEIERLRRESHYTRHDLEECNGLPLEACTTNQLASLAQRLVKERDAAQGEVGLCPHGYLKCFYCWRDAGFPGETQR